MLEQVPPLRTSQSAADIPGFFRLVADALVLHQKIESVPDGTQPVFVHDFPKERLARPDDPFDIITHRVIAAGMAPTDNEGRRVPRGPSLREVKTHSQMGRYNLRIYGWWELAQVEFTIWSRSNARADSVVEWFHRFIMKFAYAYKYFSARGVQNFRFVSRADDDIDLREGQELYRRRLVYEVRLETLDAFEEKLLESVDLNIGINRSTDTFELSD